MSTFMKFNEATDLTAAPCATETYGREYWRLIHGFTFYYTDGPQAVKVVVPRGYLFSGRTIPTEFWELASPIGRYPQLAALHEFLCEHGKATCKGKPYPIDVVLAHRVLHQATAVLGCGSMGRQMMQVIQTAAVNFTKPDPVLAAVKNNTQGKWYGNQALSAIRSFLEKEDKELKLAN